MNTCIKWIKQVRKTELSDLSEAMETMFLFPLCWHFMLSLPKCDGIHKQEILRSTYVNLSLQIYQQYKMQGSSRSLSLSIILTNLSEQYEQMWSIFSTRGPGTWTAKNLCIEVSWNMDIISKWGKLLPLSQLFQNLLQ